MTMIGLKRGTVKLVAHDPGWKVVFKEECERLQSIFGDDALGIYHVGSTSIPNISAKPIIDIAVIVESFSDVVNHIKDLEEIGYELKKDDLREDRMFFVKGPEENRTHYLHVGERSNGYVEDMILFRDCLRKKPDDARRYDELKRSLSKEYGKDRSTYTSKKGKFIREIIEFSKS